MAVSYKPKMIYIRALMAGNSLILKHGFLGELGCRMSFKEK